MYGPAHCAGDWRSAAQVSVQDAATGVDIKTRIPVKAVTSGCRATSSRHGTAVSSSTSNSVIQQPQLRVRVMRQQCDLSLTSN